MSAASVSTALTLMAWVLFSRTVTDAGLVNSGARLPAVVATSGWDHSPAPAWPTERTCTW